LVSLPLGILCTWSFQPFQFLFSCMHLFLWFRNILFSYISFTVLPSVYSARKPAELSQMCITLFPAESLDYFQPISYCSPCVANVSCRAVEQSAMFTEVGQKWCVHIGSAYFCQYIWTTVLLIYFAWLHCERIVGSRENLTFIFFCSNCLACNSPHTKSEGSPQLFPGGVPGCLAGLQWCIMECFSILAGNNLEQQDLHQIV
jgi:hypothetical protein